MEKRKFFKEQSCNSFHKTDKPTQKSDTQQTIESFSEKWSNHPSLVFEETLDPQSEIHKWILKRNGFDNLKEAAEKLKDYSKILDAGCGNGRISALLSLMVPQADILGVDINNLNAARENTSEFGRIKYQQADLSKNLKYLGNFDFIYCQEVLHHLQDPCAAFANLADLLTKKGMIAIYVYKKKAPGREFMDRYISERISDGNYEQSKRICRQLSELGEKLSNLKGEVEVEDIPILGIKKGKYPIQRFFYHHFLKCFWNEKLSLDENTAINFDWYHPRISRHFTIEEIRKWFRQNNLKITRSHEDHYGITIHGEKH